MTTAIARLLTPLARRISNLVARAVVRRADDSAKMQLLQVDVLTDETRDEVERVQNYGFTSAPFDGAEAVVLFVGGRRDHGLAVAVDDRRHRMTGLQPGEVAVYTDEGDSVVIRRGGTIEVKAATKVKVDAPLVELAGNADAVAMASKVATELDALRTTLDALVAAHNGHTHLYAPGPGAPVASATPASAATAPSAVGDIASAKVKLS